jgi:hypothetical protein
MERDMVKDILILEEEKKRKITAGRMTDYLVKNVNIIKKNYAHSITTHTNKHKDKATAPAKLSNYAGGIGSKKNDVIKEHHLPLPDYLNQSTLVLTLRTESSSK